MDKLKIIKELEKQHRKEYNKTKQLNSIRLKQIRDAMKLIESIEFIN